MRIFVMISACFFFIITLFLGLNYFSNFFINNDKSNLNVTENKKSKQITVNIKIFNNLPIRKIAELNRTYYFNLIDGQTSLINLLNSLKISEKYFKVLELNLSEIIDSDYELILIPTNFAINYYNRYSLTIEPLLNIGLNKVDAQKVYNTITNKLLTREEIEEDLKQALPTVKRKFLAIIKSFVIY